MTQAVLLNLACDRTGQGIHLYEPSGDLVAGELATRVCLQRLHVERPALPKDHESEPDLSQVRVRDTDHGDLLQVRVRLVDPLDFFRIDVLSTADVHVPASSHESDESLFVPHGKILCP